MKSTVAKHKRLIFIPFTLMAMFFTASLWADTASETKQTKSTNESIGSSLSDSLFFDPEFMLFLTQTKFKPHKKQSILKSPDTNSIFRVRSVPQAALVRSKRFRQSHTERPLVREDPRPAMLVKLVQELVRRSRGFFCRGSEERWARQLARALSEASPSPD